MPNVFWFIRDMIMHISWIRFVFAFFGQKIEKGFLTLMRLPSNFTNQIWISPTPDSIQISNCLSLSPSLINPTMALAAGELYFAFGFSLIFCCVLPRSRHSPPTKLVRHSISMGQGLCVGVLQNFGWIFKFPFQERICEYTCSICLLPSLLRVHLV